MKKLILSAVILASTAMLPIAAEAKTTSPSVGDPQIRVQIGGRQRNRRVRTYTTTRIVGFGRNRVRETVRVTVWPNGRQTSQVIRRQRVR